MQNIQETLKNTILTTKEKELKNPEYLEHMH